MHLASIELGLGLQLLERFVVCVYENLFFNQLAAVKAVVWLPIPTT